ncbi:MAG: flavin-dependent oxidoreductase [bacterium]|nr:flavin-dependent oxidoreductase [Gammaproteobacteria bacterium]HIL99262.1 flavin-dependent oxidoreductase [Pseudomonadales bacterium]
MNESNPGIIIGGGIAGLTLALALHRAGIPVRIFESAKEIRELGVGLNLLPHCVKHLVDLGLETDLVNTGVKTRELRFYCKNGKLIWTEPRGLDAGYQVPQFSIHRGRFQQILLKHVKQRLGEEAVVTDRRLIQFEQSGNEVTARFTDSTGAGSSFTGNFLVGADGINSTVRLQLYPNQGEPHFANLMLWRAASWSEPFLTGRTMIMAGHSNQKLVAYPITPPDDEGKQLINWIAEYRVPANTMRQDDWNSVGNLSEFENQFESWNFDWLQTRKLFTSAQEIYKFPMIDRDPVDRWSFGRITLAGDAAHAMYPNGSNGASQAVLDAVSLTKHISEHKDPASAFSEYELERLPLTSRLVLENRKTGPERVLQMVEDQCKGDCVEQHQCVAYPELEEVSLAYKKLAGFDKKSVNQ